MREPLYLALECPELLSEWHPRKNEGIIADKVTVGSGKKVWWRCKEGHEWQARIYSRVAGSGCPYCSGRKAIIGKNDLKTKMPKLSSEWHPTKNGDLTPSDVTIGSNQKVWWKCKEGHEWQAVVYKRAAGNNCPYCANKKVLQRYNDLETKLSKLALEWHLTKNGDLTPKDVTAGSNKKVWWKCKEGHEWQAKIYSRVSGSGCPYCSGRMILFGYNDLKTQMPELALEWHPTKNGDLRPSEVSTSSGKKVWWKCEKGHEWQAFICGRTRGNGCPYCSGRKVILGYGDLETKMPELVLEWHPTKNGDLRPSEVSISSGKKVWWKCKEGHEWQAVVSNRNKGSGCPYCRGKEVLVGYNDLETKMPDLALEWHPTKNEELTPGNISIGSNRKVWWQCKKNHEWNAAIKERVRGNGCPYCTGKMPIKGVNDLQTVESELALEWHPTKNRELKPNNVLPGSDKKVWWQCREGHEWRATIKNRTRGRCGCPVCK